MTETQTLQGAKKVETLPPHFFCDCVPDLGPAHCHRCTRASDNGIVEWSKAPCQDLVTSFAYQALLTAGVDASLLLISEAFDLERDEQREEAEMVAGMAAWLSAEGAEDEAQADPAAEAPAPAIEHTVLVAVPAPPKTRLISAQEHHSRAATAGSWRFTNLARKQCRELVLIETDIVSILESPHVKVPSYTGTATNHYGDGLLIMVDIDGECIISVIKCETPISLGHRSAGPSSSAPSASSSASSTSTPVKQKTHSGGAGRRMPSNVKEFLTMLNDHGFVTELGGKGHHLTTHPHHPDVRISVPSSPSDTRSYKNTVADIKRRTGIDITKKD